jgi:hypothetical protein
MLWQQDLCYTVSFVPSLLAPDVRTSTGCRLVVVVDCIGCYNGCYFVCYNLTIT